MTDSTFPKAIPTRYDGHLFRSRLEARWALFFNFVGLRWEFEREAFSLEVEGKRVGYTPDFWLPELNAWFEVKAAWESFSEDEQRAMVRKLTAFAQVTDARVFVAMGTPKDSEIVESTADAKNIRSVVWGRCGECLAWHLGWPEVEERSCGHRSVQIGFEQARGALVDASAHRFWEPA